MEDKLIKNNPISSDEITLLREKFISEYSRKKGWNPKELSTTQRLEITTPGIILG